MEFIQTLWAHLTVPKLIARCAMRLISLKNLSKRTKLMLMLISSFVIISFGIEFYVITFYIDNMPLPIILMSAISLLIFLYISILSLYKTTKLEMVNRSLDEAQMHNKSMEAVNEGLRVFKHDFSNIMQCIDGYIINDDMGGLKNYYKGIKNECDDLNNLSFLNSNLINDPAIYSLISSKYNEAQELGITFNIIISVNFDDIPTTPYILTRVLGILLDNAIEASKASKEKEISFEVSIFSNNSKIKKYLISIQNTYANKDIDINRIHEKGYTSKNFEEGSHGLGLWEVNKILKRNKNLNLYTTKNDKFFIQELEIYGLQ